MKCNKSAVLSMVVFAGLCIFVQSALAAPVISVVPAQQTVWQGENVTVNITVNPLGSEVMGVQYDLYFDALLLNATEQISGPFLSQDGTSTIVVTNEINNTLGLVGYGETRMGVEYGVTSPGTLATIRFKAMEPGTSSLSLNNVIVSDPLGGSISGILINDGSVEILSTYFNITGFVSYEDGSPVYGPNVTITNLNTGEVFRADTNESSNYYQLHTNFAHVTAGDLLRCYASDNLGNFSTVNHEVTQAELNAGGFVQNFTIFPPDLTPPVISNVSGIPAGIDAVTIAWETDEPADSRVKYGTQPGNYTVTVSNASYVLQHQFTLTGLTPNATYYFIVNSTDPSGNPAQSTEQNVTTRAEVLISIGSAVVLPGENATLSIYIHHVINLGIADIQLAYNGSVAAVTVVESSDFDFMDASIDNTAGVTRIVAFQTSSPGLNEQVLLANVTLAAVGSGGASSSLMLHILELKAAGPDEKSIPAIMQNGTFTIIETVPPEVTSPSANPPCIPEDTDSDPRWGEISHLNITVTDNWGVASVTINFSALGGLAEQPMARISGTDIWTASISAPPGAATYTNGSYMPLLLMVTATDLYGNTNNTITIPLVIMRNGDVSENGEASLYDGMYLAKHILAKPGFETMKNELGEVSGNGAVSMYDAMYLSKHVLGEPGFEILH